MKKKLTALLLGAVLCLSLFLPAYASEDETVDSSTVTVSVTELSPGYYLCAIWRGDTLLRLFDYTVGPDGKLEATVEIGEKLETGDLVTVGISNANTGDAAAGTIPPVICEVKNPSSDKPTNPDNPDTPDKPSTPSFSGPTDSGTPSYSITAPSKPENGAVKLNKTSARKGDTVTLTATPDSGYKLASLTVKDRKGNAVATKDIGGGKYTFTMPAGKVTVEAAFKKIPTAASFTDVPSGSWYYDAVAWAIENEITEGTSESAFSPDNLCQQAQILTFLWRAAGKPENSAKIPVTLDASLRYAEDAVLWAAENGMIGLIDGTFQPKAPCTRATAVKFIWQAAGSPKAGKATGQFTDIPDDADYAEAVAWAVEKQITNGTSATTFSPDSVCTRAQIMTFLHRDRTSKT